MRLARRPDAYLPLLPQMLWPILVVEVVLLTTIVSWYSHESIKHLHSDTTRRAEIIAQSIENRGQSEIANDAINRQAESFHANNDVEEVTVIDRTSGIIRNSSNPQLVGKPLSSHPDEVTRAELAAMMKPNAIYGIYSDHSYLYLMPTILAPATSGGHSLQSVILVRLDVTEPWMLFWRDIIAFGLTGGLLICATILLFYGMLYIHIYRPLSALRNIMQRFTGGERQLAFPPMHSSEFSDLSTTLRAMLEKQVENEEQLTTYTNQMQLLTMEMETARDEALRANQMKSEFLATMSHEIRTPMNGVIGMTDLLLDSGLTSKQSHFARTVQQSAEALLSLIDDILDFSKIEAGKIELEKTPFNLTDLFESLGNILSVKARDKSLELVIQIDPNLPNQFIGDPARLRQVMVNLVGNAVKFTHHGYVMLSVQAAPGTNLATVTEGSVLPLAISIKDTGVGIPPEMQKRVFEKFIQADSSTTRKYGGTGLGLAICQQLVHLMEGSITLESAVNEGTTFTVHLPLPVGKIRQAEATYPELIGKRIMVVDDLPINLTILQKQLEHLGMVVTPALNGKQATELSEAALRRQQPFDVFLIDYIMPVQNGEQVGTTIHRQPDHEKSPLVMMSASDGQGYQKRFAELGFVALLAKPIGLGVLAETISDALRNNAPQESIAPSQTVAKGSYTGKRVLVADDNRSNREYISTLLEEMGFTVDEAINGIVALKKVTDGEHFDLVLMDCEMPELDGRTATRNIRRKLSPADLPILALTGHTDTAEIDLCRNVGMNDCLAKPLRRADLETAVRKWLPLPPAAVNADSLHGRNVLLVEDNRFNREFMTELLTSSGINVYTADNGHESLKMLGRYTYIDAILMDCQMPEMDGYEATEKIRQRQASGEWPYIPIIALTANAMKGDREKCLAVGMDDYLTKPLNKQQLFTVLTGWFGKPAPNIEHPTLNTEH